MDSWMVIVGTGTILLWKDLDLQHLQSAGTPEMESCSR